jgi:hypothetical protein
MGRELRLNKNHPMRMVQSVSLNVIGMEAKTFCEFLGSKRRHRL